jgi:hypothetical protein
MMKLAQHSRFVMASIVAISSLVISQAAFSQARPTVSKTPEPARWTQEDVTTAQKFATAKKDIDAAKYDAIIACKSVQPAQHSSCVAEANRIYAEDMAAAQKYFYPGK